MSTIKTGTTLTTAYQVEADTTGNFVIATGTSANVAMTVNSSGNAGLGVTPSAWGSLYRGIDIDATTALYNYTDGTNVQSNLYCNAFINSSAQEIYKTSAAASSYRQIQGSHNWYTAASGTAGNAITFTQAMKLDASGLLAIGRTTAWDSNALLTLEKSGAAAQVINSTTNSVTLINVANGSASIAYTGTASNHPFAFYTNNTERARITADGDWLVGTTTADPVVSNVVGGGISSAGIIRGSATSSPSLGLNRRVDDGDLVHFYQAGTLEGSISVSGNTVSYNAFAGSHWSQLQDGSKPDILRGTVMESINELCVWPGESNERLPKSKISDTAGSKKVYGVFMAWDNDWTETNDMLVTSVGAFICRVNGSVTVQEGDLLESNGDGTARVQADDIIRSSTIGKVTSTVKTHEYDDGSYCVPTVLYCG